MPETRPHSNPAPETIREVGLVVEGIRKDLVRLDRKVDAYTITHADIHSLLMVDVDLNTDWRKERQVYGRLMRWLIGSNFIAIVMAVLVVFVFFEAR